jgi:cell division protein FtsW
MSAATILIGRGTPQSSARVVAVLAAGLSLFGLLLVASIGDGALGGEPFAYAKRQAVYLALGALCAILARAFDYRLLARRSKEILGGVWLLCGLLLVLPVKEQMGARRWFEVPGLGHFQPSEAAKVALVIWCGAYASARGVAIREFRRGALPGLVVVAITAGLVLLQKDLGTTLLLGVIGTTALVLGGARIGHVLPVVVAAAPALVIAMSRKFDYVKARLDVFRAAPSESGSLGQVDQALIALGSGGWFGRGLGDGRAHLGYVPQIHNDFILAAAGEQTGFVGAAAIATALLLFFLHGTRVAASSKDRFGFTLAYGCSFLVALQGAVNVAVAVKLVPPKGINLPFVSYGGSSMLFLGTCVGLIASVARRAALDAAEEEEAVAAAARERAVASVADVAEAGPEEVPAAKVAA